MASRCFMVILGLALAAPASLGQEPSLGEIAKREKKRRKAAAGAARTITEEELKKPSAGTFSTPEGPAAGATPAASPAAGAPATAPGAAPAASPEKTEEQLRAEREQQWREELQKARDEVVTHQDQVSKLEAATGDTSQNVYSASRANRIAALEQARAQLAQARQRVEELETTGRQNGFR